MYIYIYVYSIYDIYISCNCLIYIYNKVFHIYIYIYNIYITNIYNKQTVSYIYTYIHIHRKVMMKCLFSMLVRETGQKKTERSKWHKTCVRNSWKYSFWLIVFDYFLKRVCKNVSYTGQHLKKIDGNEIIWQSELNTPIA